MCEPSRRPVIRYDSREFPNACVIMEFPPEVSLKVEKLVDRFHDVRPSVSFTFPDMVCLCIDYIYDSVFEDDDCVEGGDE